jgi:hypothetical protein
MSNEEVWKCRYFAMYEDGEVYAWQLGRTSWSNVIKNSPIAWKYAKLADEGGYMTDKEYREVGKSYLEPIKSVSIRINSLKEDLNNTMNDIVSIGAIDYSKERLSGGGTPTGIERCIL